MRIKASVIVLLAAAMAAACTEDTLSFTVHGTAVAALAPEGANVVRLYRDGVQIDSCTVSGGRFSFSGQQDKTSLYYTVLNLNGDSLPGDNATAVFIPDAENIYIDLDYPATVTGSPLTDCYTAFESEVHSLLASEGWVQALAELCRSTFLEHKEDIVGLQALTLLQLSSGPASVGPLIGEAAPFIRQDSLFTAPADTLTAPADTLTAPADTLTADTLE